MKIIPFEALYNTEVFISEPISKTQSWAARGNVFNALGKPKISHTLLWFKNCSATITDADGGVLEVSKNQLTYMAKGTEYRVDFKDTVPDRVDTIVVHFQMTDKTGEDVAPVLHPVICFKNVDLSHALVLDELAEECKKNIVCLPLVASVIYKLLADICQKQKSSVTKNKFACIRSGIELLEQDSDLSIADIAFRCGVSECYFRRLFREYSGESPMSFRQHHRIEKAKQLLMLDTFTIGEIARELHFSDIYHFSKTFKKLVGISPQKYLQQSLQG